MATFKVTESEYKGHKVFEVRKDDDSEKPIISFGLRKLNAILAVADQLQEAFEEISSGKVATAKVTKKVIEPEQNTDENKRLSEAIAVLSSKLQ
ncbi:MAG: hypothetical protein ACO2ZP_04940 [Bacteriovoracaceae bacterium]